MKRFAIVSLFVLAMGGLLAPVSLAGMECCTNAKEAGLVCASCTPDAKAEINKPALDFQLKDSQGNTHALSDYKGKIVVLTWTSPGCPFVQRHAQEGTFNSLASKFGEDKVVVLEIDSDANGQPAAAESDKSANSPKNVLTLHDPDGKIGQAYGAKTTPHSFVVDASGKLAYQGAPDNDPSGKMKPEERENYLAEAITELQAGQQVKNQTTKPYGCGIKYTTKNDEKKAHDAKKDEKSPSA